MEVDEYLGNKWKKIESSSEGFLKNKKVQTSFTNCTFFPIVFWLIAMIKFVGLKNLVDSASQKIEIFHTANVKSINWNCYEIYFLNQLISYEHPWIHYFPFSLIFPYYG